MNSWTSAPDEPSLATREIHIWRAQLEMSDACHETLRATLSADELNRASRFVKREHRVRFEAGRGVLRDILSRYKRRPASELRLTTGAFGKPTLVDSHLRFNASHSGAVALYGVALHSNVGVDIECINAHRADNRIAERYFSDAERDALRLVPVDARASAFFHCWTRKEAYLKAIGTGLSGSLRSFTVSIGEHDSPFDVNGIWIAPLDVGPGMAAAVATLGAPSRLRRYDWLPADTSQRSRAPSRESRTMGGGELP